ncbi:MBL fold metallo-hydrolase [Paenarthrobacter sp. AR 02]|nr:MBL fold metallo-hydrolase [Paenarthrobacter sp. AR 02]
MRKVPGARIRIGREDLGSVSSSAPLRSLSEGDRIWGLQVIETPGHTKGHISLLSHDEGLLFVGDAVGSMGGMVVRPPAAFTADAAMAEKSLRKLCALSPARTLFSHGAEVPDAALQIQALLSGQPESLPESGH